MRLLPKEPTPRLNLKNPSTGEFDWDKSWWENTDIIDNYPGILVVTEATLPEEPWVGQHVFNMDDLSLLCWNGANWINQSSGMFDYLTVGPGGINQGDVVYIDGNGHIQKASNDMEEKYAFRVAGIALRNLNEGEKGLVKKTGMVRCPEWNLTIGKHYFLGTNGNITDVKPDIEVNLIQVIGVATAADALSIRISSPYVSFNEIKSYVHKYFVEDENFYINEYGLEWNQTNDTYTRLGDASSLSVPDAGTDGYKNSHFDDKLPWTGMKRCNLADDLTVNAYYGDPTYTTDGSNGQVMVEIPKFWYKSENDTSGDNIYRWWIADGPKDGYNIHPAFIRNGEIKDNIYVGAFEGFNNGGTYESKAGVEPTNNQLLETYRSQAENRNNGWALQDFLITSAIQLLYVIEYGNFDSQNTIGKGITDDYKQNTGKTNGNQTYGIVSNGMNPVSYRGIENIYGNLLTVLDGIIIKEDGFYIENNITNFNDSGTGYQHIPVDISLFDSLGYISDIYYTSQLDYGFIGEQMNGSNSTYFYDYEYIYDQNINTCNFGGYYNKNLKCGIFCWEMNKETTYTGADYSSRLMAIRI